MCINKLLVVVVATVRLSPVPMNRMRMKLVRGLLPTLRSRPLPHLRTLTSKLDANAHDIYVSSSTNPYFNLAFEDWYVPRKRRDVARSRRFLSVQRLFKHKKPSEPLFFLYKDDPCIIIGRNQNPFKEVNLRLARQRGIPFIRRMSGGGAVYHVRPFQLFPDH